MFSKIKNYFLQRYLADHKPHRHKVITSLEGALSLGVICEITDENSYKDVMQLFSSLSKTHKVKMIGYTQGKEVPFYCLPQLTADYFCDKNLNWFGNPQLVQIQDFLDVDFDMLIDFNYRTNLPIHALLAQSKAKFIVGRNEESSQYYDLFINTSSESNQTFIEDIITYTKKLTGNDK